MSESNLRRPVPPPRRLSLPNSVERSSSGSPVARTSPAGAFAQAAFALQFLTPCSSSFFDTEVNSPKADITSRMLQPVRRWVVVVMPCCALFVGGLTVTMFISDLAFYAGRGLIQQCSSDVQDGDGRWTVTLCMAASLLLAPGAMWLLLKAPTPHLRCVAGHATLVWAAMWMRTMEQVLLCGERTPGGTQRAASFQLCADVFYGFSAIAFCVLLFHRVSALGAFSMQQSGLRLVQSVFLGLMATWCTGTIGWAAVHSGEAATEGPWHKVVALLVHCGLLLYITYNLLCLRILARARSFALQASCQASDTRQAGEAAQAASALLMQGLGVTVGSATSAVVFGIYVAYRGFLWPLPASPAPELQPEGHELQGMFLVWPSVLDALANGFSSLALSGALSISGDRAAQSLVRDRLRRRERFTTQGRQEPEGSVPLPVALGARWKLTEVLSARQEAETSLGSISLGLSAGLGVSWRLAAAAWGKEAGRAESEVSERERDRQHEARPKGEAGLGPELELETAWHRGVEELAGRGLTLAALLRFYRGLGTHYMERWDSERHTTADVVVQAIVPLTRKRRQAMATQLMRGKYTRPKRMVTHCWSNKFRNLVAGVLADAIGESEYEPICYLLDHDIVRLEEWVRSLHVHKETYWICAFSVNQHLGICDRSILDTVTGAAYPLCPCDLPKARNDTPPRLPDGRSIPCEMNKFQDMMAFLAASDPNFGQVIAVDANFKLFTRAWCVAEIHTAHQAGMMQSMKFRSITDLEMNKSALETLRIQNMEASRFEDKDFILSHIEDPEEFNLQLRSLVMQDLVPVWEKLDACQKMAKVGSLLRRKWPGLELFWQEEVLQSVV